MSRALFYTPALPGVGDVAVVDGDEGFHAASVRRIRVGEELDLGDGAGTVAHVVVENVGKGSLATRVLDVRTVAVPSPEVTVVQALPKSDRSELAVELATEAGADAIVAWQADRCVARWDGRVKEQKGLRRWEAVARAAARQSRRAHVPSISGLVTTRELATGLAASTATILVLHESASRPLPEVPLDGVTSVTLIVGPEGGISDDELAALEAAGAVTVRLGPTVLRTSTAAAVALGALGAVTPRWSAPDR